MRRDHDWLVVGPWWTWPKESDPLPRDGARATRPIIQKYADSRMVERFLADPQDSLRFLDDEDRYRTDRVLGRPIATIDPGTGKQLLRRRVSVVTSIRKLFRDTHQRFYLVVCSVHCDRPGLPRVRRDDVLDARFVVRRRRTAPAPVLGVLERKHLAEELDAALRAELTHQEQVVALTNQLTGLPLGDEVMPTLAAAVNASDALALAKTRLAETSVIADRTEIVERWATGPAGESATWRPILDGIGEGVETTYPLYPLVPPEDDPDHDGAHGSIWFGVVPTGSDETQPDGSPRFDPGDDLEIRCVVRRRNPRCPDRPEHAITVWSDSTERYRLAPHTDALGLANRPVTLPAPDLAQLKAQAEALLPGQLSSARVEQAAGSRFSFPDNDGAFPESANEENGDEVCFFAIPLITFVAMFLLQIFLPILLFLLNLWWMLQLKFCIPPSASFDVDLSADIVARPGGFELDVVVDFDVELTAAERAQVQAEVDRQLDANFTPAAKSGIQADSSLQEQWQLLRNIQRAQESAAAGTLRTGGALLPVERVDWSEVVVR